MIRYYTNRWPAHFTLQPLALSRSRQIVLLCSLRIPFDRVRTEKPRENAFSSPIMRWTYRRETQHFNIKGVWAQPPPPRRTNSSGRSGDGVRTRPMWRFRDPVIARTKERYIYIYILFDLSDARSLVGITLR